MSLIPITVEQGRAACADPVHLPLVDAAHDKPGGPEAQRMARELCATCPVFDQCLHWSMTHGEAGVWAGTSPNLRGRHGAPKKLPATPAYTYRGREGVPLEEWRRKPSSKSNPGKAGARRHNRAAARCTELGVREGQVRQWAYDHGLVDSQRGRVSLALVEQYASAHQPQQRTA